MTVICVNAGCNEKYRNIESQYVQTICETWSGCQGIGPEIQGSGVGFLQRWLCVNGQALNSHCFWKPSRNRYILTVVAAYTLASLEDRSSPMNIA